MNKEWILQQNGDYLFMAGGEPAGTMRIAVSSTAGKADISIGGNTRMLQRTGFWKTRLQLTDAAGRVIAHAAPEHWYGRKLRLEYQGRQYQLFIRNNPLAEWVIRDGDKDILAYALDTANGKAAVRITAAPHHDDYWLDALLWYLFWPIAKEQMSDDMLFLVMAGA